MQRPVIALLIVALLSVDAVAAVAQEPSPSPLESDGQVGLSEDVSWNPLPLSLDGQAVRFETQSGVDWIARLKPGDPESARVIEAVEALAITARVDIADLTMATSYVELVPGNRIEISAIHVPDSRSYDLVEPALDVFAGEIAEPTQGWDQVSGRWYSFSFDRASSPDQPALAYPAGDTVWVIRAPWQDDSVSVWWDKIETIVAALPPQTTDVGPITSLTQHVEIPGLGITATFPSDWAVEILPPMPVQKTVRAQKQAARWVRRLGIDAPYVVALHAEGPANPRLSGPPVCSLVLFGPTEQEPSTIAGLVREQLQRCSVADEPRPGLLRARTYPSDCGGPSAGFLETFVVGEHDMVAYLTCWSKDLPGDRGLSIAESIEFLPAEE